MGIELRYIPKNRRYQKVLDVVYCGKVVPVERYVSPKLVIKHYCLQCRTLFFARPSSLLNDPMQRHDCRKSRYDVIIKQLIIENENIPPKPENKSKKKKEQKEPKKVKRVSPELVQKMISLYNQGYSKTAIAKELQLNVSTVCKHLKKAGNSQ